MSHYYIHLADSIVAADDDDMMSHILGVDSGGSGGIVGQDGNVVSVHFSVHLVDYNWLKIIQSL